MCWLGADTLQQADSCFSTAFACVTQSVTVRCTSLHYRHVEELERAAQAPANALPGQQDVWVEALVYLYIGRAIVYAHSNHEVWACRDRLAVPHMYPQLPCQQAMDAVLELINRGHLPDRPVAACTFHATQLCCRHAVSCLSSGQAGHSRRIATVMLTKVRSVSVRTVLICVQQACALLQAVSLEAEEEVLQDVATAAANLQAEVRVDLAATSLAPLAPCRCAASSCFCTWRAGRRTKQHCSSSSLPAAPATRGWHSTYACGAADATCVQRTFVHTQGIAPHWAAAGGVHCLARAAVWRAPRGTWLLWRHSAQATCDRMMRCGSVCATMRWSRCSSMHSTAPPAPSTACVACSVCRCTHSTPQAVSMLQPHVQLFQQIGDAAMLADMVAVLLPPPVRAGTLAG